MTTIHIDNKWTTLRVANAEIISKHLNKDIRVVIYEGDIVKFRAIDPADGFELFLGSIANVDCPGGSIAGKTTFLASTFSRDSDTALGDGSSVTGGATETKQIELIGISTEDRDLSIERNRLLDEILQRTIVAQSRGIDIETFTVVANSDGDAVVLANDRRKIIIQNVSVTDTVWIALGSAGKNKGFRITPLEKFVLEDYTGSIFFYCEEGNAEVYITEIS
jgi:hypothetical protein